MQLDSKKQNKPNTRRKSASLTDKLTLASTALLGMSAQAQEVDAEWKYSASLLGYTEPDRVSATELIVAADKVFGDSAIANIKVVLDSLTGASANGAIEQSDVQTFTRPSGKGQYQTPAFTAPLDDTFKDTRLQINASWSDVYSQQSRYTLATNLSREYDYRSIGVSGELAWDFDRKNTTLSAGLSYANDEIIPEGGIPLAFASMVIDQGQYDSRDDYWSDFDLTRKGRKRTTETKEVLLGWTQVINRRTLIQVNYGFADMQGYLTDPFKVISRVDLNGNTQDLVYEGRPSTRKQQSLFGLMKYHFDDSIFDLSYRFIRDDWGMRSHTFDSHWRFLNSKSDFWEIHLRLYQQSETDFYQPFLLQSEPLPTYASSDYRIGKMDAYTIGLKYGFELGHGDSAEVRLEFYQQQPKESIMPNNVSGIEPLTLYPRLDALILQINYFF